jgi:hypothetical protein
VNTSTERGTCAVESSHVVGKIDSIDSTDSTDSTDSVDSVDGIYTCMVHLCHRVFAGGAAGAILRVCPKVRLPQLRGRRWQLDNP